MTMNRVRFQPGLSLPEFYRRFGYLVSEAKARLPALALERHVGVVYPTAWLIHHKPVQAISEHDGRYTLRGTEARLGGERACGQAERGSEYKIPFVAAASADDKSLPSFVKFTLPPALRWRPFPLGRGITRGRAAG